MEVFTCNSISKMISLVKKFAFLLDWIGTTLSYYNMYWWHCNGMRDCHWFEEYLFYLSFTVELGIPLSRSPYLTVCTHTEHVVKEEIFKVCCLDLTLHCFLFMLWRKEKKHLFNLQFLFIRLLVDDYFPTITMSMCNSEPTSNFFQCDWRRKKWIKHLVSVR